MRKETYIKSYTAAELRASRGRGGADLIKVDAMTDADVERAIAEDEDGLGLQPDPMLNEMNVHQLPQRQFRQSDKPVTLFSQFRNSIHNSGACVGLGMIHMHDDD